MMVRYSVTQLSATLIALLSIHVADEGHAVNPSCSCIRFTSGGRSGAERGTFSSPDYPRPYPSGLCLLYTFLAQPHQIVELVFTDFDIYKEHLDCTRGDYIKVYWEVQGPGPPGAINERSSWSKVLCGGRVDIPPALYSPGQSLVLEFHMGARQNNATGFLGTYSFIDKHSYELDTRIVGGDNAPDGIAPYQVSLRIYLNKLINFHFCGGSIISNKWILTSAYCTKGLSAEILTAVVGTNLLKSGGDSYSIESITDHEDFDQKTLYNDISLLYTTEAIQFNDKVKPIALPEGDTEPGSKCLLTGWGYTDKLRLHMPNNLQLLTVPTISTYACQKKYKLKKKIDVIEKQICTYVQKGRGGCEGDSGGPLVKESRLVGIVSREVPCARGFPDIYTRVYSYLDWINGKIGN